MIQERVIAAVKATAGKLDDYGQRSALGMARSWLNTQELKLGANSLDLYPRRDELAVELVAILETADSNEECVAALRAARDWVNAPFQRSKVLGARLSTPGEAKKRAASE